MMKWIVALGVLATVFGIQSGLADEPVSIAIGKAKFNPLLQVYATSDSAAGANGALNFRIRRAELKFSGPATDLFRWWVMIDAAKSPALTAAGDNKILQDLGIAYLPVEDLEVWLGQFKILTTDDSLEPSATTLLPERSVMTRQTFGDRRQSGLAVHFKNSAFRLGAMISNGGPNINDTTTAKDLSTRFELTVIQNLSFGGWLWSPDMDFSNNLAYGAFAKWSDDALFARVEYGSQTASASTTSGLYGEVGYKVTEQIQPMARFDLLNSPTGFENGYVITGGVNWLYLKHNVKIQGAFSYLNNASGAFGSPTVTTALASGSTRPTATMFILAAVLGL